MITPRAVPKLVKCHSLGSKKRRCCCSKSPPEAENDAQKMQRDGDGLDVYSARRSTARMLGIDLPNRIHVHWQLPVQKSASQRPVASSCEMELVKVVKATIAPVSQSKMLSLIH